MFFSAVFISSTSILSQSYTGYFERLVEGDFISVENWNLSEGKVWCPFEETVLEPGVYFACVETKMESYESQVVEVSNTNVDNVRDQSK